MKPLALLRHSYQEIELTAIQTPFPKVLVHFWLYIAKRYGQKAFEQDALVRPVLSCYQSLHRFPERAGVFVAHSERPRRYRIWILRNQFANVLFVQIKQGNFLNRE